MKRIKNIINKATFDYIFLVLLGALIIIGSVGIFQNYTVPLTLAVSFSFIGIKFLKGERPAFPKNYNIFFLFLISILLHTLFFNGKIVYFWLFLSAGTIGVLAFNIKPLVQKNFFPFLVFFGIFMAIIFVILKSRGINSMDPDNLFLPLNGYVLHNHIGDLWALILIGLIYYFFTNQNFIILSLFLIGVVMVFISFSRSALVTWIVGSALIFNSLSSEKFKKTTQIFIFFLFGIILIYFSVFKPIFSSRPYFAEAISGVIKYPLGIGMGNFTKISPETNVVHNLVLEVVVGMGIFSIPFLYWLFKVAKNVFSLMPRNLLFGTLFISLFINFFFDTTYVLPGLLWVWFILLSAIE